MDMVLTECFFSYKISAGSLCLLIPFLGKRSSSKLNLLYIDALGACLFVMKSLSINFDTFS